MSKSAKSPPPPPGPQALAIVGMGCLFPGADSLEGYWANIKAGRDVTQDIPESHWDPEHFFDQDPGAPDMTYAKRGGFLRPVAFDPLEFGISPNNIEATDTTQLLGMVVAREALRDAGYSAYETDSTGRSFDRDRTSVILGVTGALELVISLGARLGHPIWRRALRSSGVDADTAEQVVHRISDSYVPWQENSFPGLLGNVAAGRIANRFDLGGTNCVVDAACASSLSAIHMAAMELESGRSDMVISGGLDTFNDIFMYMCFSKTPALSPTGRSRPFASDSDGTILGEGLGVVILKRHQDALRDDDHVYAIIRGIGSSSDGRGNAIYAPRADGQAKAMRTAYQRAEVSPDTVELIEAHGTGTKVGDATEIASISEVYREARASGTWCAVGSVKSMIGHTKAAAGVAGLIKTAIALSNKVLPPTVNVTQPLEATTPGKSPVYVNTVARPWLARPDHPRRAAVSAFGFGGSNFHAVLEESHSEKRSIDWNDDVLLFAFSADDIDGIESDLAALSDADWPRLRRQAANSRQQFDAAKEYRLALVAERSVSDLPGLATKAAELIGHLQADSTANLAVGIFAARGSTAGRLAVVFPGQGSQYVGMLRELSCQFPPMLDALAAFNDVYGIADHGRRLSDQIYPMPVFNDEDRVSQELALRDTSIAQPAIGAVSMGGFRVLEAFGLQVDAVAGHSFGELTALWAAGSLADADFCQMAVTRGLLMAQLDGDRGAMLAVSAPVSDIEALLEAQTIDLVIANRNAPRQCVLSGATASIESAEQIFAGAGMSVQRLEVSAAFHSPLVADAEQPFSEALEVIEFAPGRCPVYANTTGDTYPDDSRSARRLLTEQLTNPVNFVREIEQMYQAGIRTFVEAGPHRRLAALIGAILGDAPHHVLSMDQSLGKRSGNFDLACTLGSLASCGHRLDLTCWDAAFAELPEPPARSGAKMQIAVTGANHFQAPEQPELPAAPVIVAPNPILEPNPAPVKDDIPLPPTTPVSPAPTGRAASIDLNQALQATQSSVLALQNMAQQTAQLHQQYLEGQETAQRTIERLVYQQQQLFASAMGTAPVPPIAQVAPPAPEPMPAPAPLSEPAPTPEPTPTPEPVAATVAPIAPQPTDEIVATLLAVTAEKTGYPVDMLELPMSLDVDLGIDSIKRVEIFSALQERRPALPPVKPEDLGRLHTLAQVVDYLQSGDPKSPAQESAILESAILESAILESAILESAILESSTTANPEPAGPSIDTLLLDVVAEKTGYPSDMLAMDMSLDVDLGIDSIKRVEILSALQERLPGAPVVKPEQFGSIRVLADISKLLTTVSLNSTPGPSALSRRVLALRELDETVARDRETLPTTGIWWITDDGLGLARAIEQTLQTQHIDARVVSLDAVPNGESIAGLVIVAPPEPDRNFIAETFRLLRNAGPCLRATGNEQRAILAAVSRFDGAFGLNGSVPSSPLSGGLAGLVKTAAQEWPEVRCKAIDLADEQREFAELATCIVDELSLSGPTEVGLCNGGRFGLELRDAPFNGDLESPPINPGDLMVITGGARGITAEVSKALAESLAPTLLLLGRSPEPQPEPHWLHGCEDSHAMKAAIAEQLCGASAALTPKELEQHYHRWSANREVLRTLQGIRDLGVAVFYRSVDVRDKAGVEAAIAETRAIAGPVRGLIHAAGVLADGLIEDKTDAQFHDVFSTKVDGLDALLNGIGDDDLKLLVLFSSSTGRFGRRGQVDYAAANEVLNKTAQRQAKRFPDCRVVSLNWGPWDGGMVTPELKRLFADEGVGVIPLRSGADHLVREITTAGDNSVEVVVLGQVDA